MCGSEQQYLVIHELYEVPVDPSLCTVINVCDPAKSTLAMVPGKMAKAILLHLDLVRHLSETYRVLVIVGEVMGSQDLVITLYNVI